MTLEGVLVPTPVWPVFRELQADSLRQRLRTPPVQLQLLQMTVLQRHFQHQLQTTLVSLVLQCPLLLRRQGPLVLR